ncbi:MAG: hypothetical protein MUP90_04105 [Gammaproteobacteria bacterium]|nr:hypothetical protein [Gammaproteobacteria bacterium]
MSSITRVAGLVTLAVLSGLVSAAESDDTWSAEFVPYLWAASLQGTTAAGDAESPIDPGYSLFTMENLSGAFMGALRVSRGHWSWQLDTLHVDFQDDFDRQFIDTHIGISGGFLEIAAGYRPEADGNLAWLAGLRNVTFTTEVGLAPGLAGEAKKSWLDPFVGVHYRYPISDTWAVRLRGDVGGMNPSARLTFNGLVAVEYAFSMRLQGLLGYRYLELDFRDSDFLLDLSASGFALGLSMRY